MRNIKFLSSFLTIEVCFSIECAAMSDDDVALGLGDSMDSDEDIFSTHNRRHGPTGRRCKNSRTLRSHAGSSPHISANNLSVRRSTRNRMQTYDNLNTSWILGMA